MSVSLFSANGSDYDPLKIYLYEGEDIQLCGTLETSGCSIDPDLEIIIPLVLYFPPFQPDARTYECQDFSTSTCMQG